MKNIYLEVHFTGTNSLPDYFKPQQYINTSLKENATEKAGNIGQLEYSFLVDAKHPYENAETENNIWLNNILINGKNFISKSTLSEKFYIIEIDDYSHQSMSTGYTDFVPLVFKEGTKIPQKYISIIKYYTTKKAFILIDKKYGEIKSADNISILIAFKDTDRNDVESRMKDKSVTLNKVGNVFTKAFTPIDSKLKFLFAFQNKNMNDYYFTFKNSNNKDERINPVTIKKFEIIYGDNKIQKQSNFFTLVAKSRNISQNGNSEVLENDSMTINVEFYNPVNVGNSITLHSRSNLTDVYIKSNNNTYNDSFYYDKLFSTDFWCFDNNGYKKDLDNYRELIPQYSNKRVISFKAKSNEYTIQELLNNQVRPEIYRWNLCDPEILCFDKDGKFKGAVSYNTKPAVDDEIILYDNLEEIDETLRSTTRIGVSGLIEDLTEIVNGETIEYSIDKGFSVLGETDEYFETNTPMISFYAMVDMKAENDDFYKTRFYTMMKYYPVYYEEYKVNDYTVYYKLPDNILNNLNRELYNSISSKVFIERTPNLADNIYLLNLNEIPYNGSIILPKLSIEIPGFANIKTNTDYDETKSLSLSDEKNNNKLYFKYGSNYVKDLDDEDLEYKGPKQYYIKFNGDDDWYPTNLIVSSNMESYEIRSMDYIENEGLSNERIIKIKGLIEKTFGDFNRLVPILYTDENDNVKTVPFNKGVSICIKANSNITSSSYNTILIGEHSIVTS